MQVRQVGYRLVEFLGEGLNSCVYKAIKETPEFGVKFEVALKILKSEKMVEIWRNEFKRLEAVQSQHCVRLLGWEIVSDKPALVLEYVRGTTLADLVSEVSITEGGLIEVLAQCYRGLVDLRKAGMFHGDLNLHNVMIDEKGVVKLVDFGVFGRGGEIMTTARFADPELLMGGQPSFRTDMYSLRVIGAEISQKQKLPVLVEFEKLRSTVKQRAQLAQKVRALLTHRQNRQGLTEKIKRVQKACWTWVRVFRAGVFVALTCFSLLSSGDQVKKSIAKEAVISVRSRNWILMNVDGRERGYAPLNLVVSAEGPVRLKWRSAKGVGQTSLTLSHGQHIVLGDEFFRRHDFRPRSGAD